MTNMEEQPIEDSDSGSGGSSDSDNEGDVESISSSSSASEGDRDEARIDDDDGEDVEGGNAGWADSMSKILKSNKPKTKKTIVLSKAKKDTDRKKKKREKADFEIIGEEGASGAAKDAEDRLSSSDEDEPASKKKRDEEKHPNFRTKPTLLEREREKLLSKIATRGVVQLFNTVRNQQKELESKIEAVGPLERKKEKIIKSLDKNKFLDVLMGQTKSEVVNKALETKIKKSKEEVKEESGSGWDVFREDFMMGSNMKDWNRKGPTLEAEDAPETVESGSE